MIKLSLILCLWESFLLKFRWFLIGDDLEILLSDFEDDTLRNEILKRIQGRKTWRTISRFVSKLPIPIDDSHLIDYRGLTIKNKDLTGCHRLSDLCFDFCTFHSVKISNVTLNGCFFRFGNFEDCDFYESNLHHVNFEYAKIKNSVFEKTVGKRLLLNNCLIEDSLFDSADWKSIKVNSELCLFPFFYLILLGFIFRKYRIGCGTVIRHLKTGRIFLKSSNSNFYNFYCMQEKLDKLRKSQSILFWVAYVFTNHGKSASRFFCWIVFSWFFFGAIYSLSGSHLPNEQICPMIDWGKHSIYNHKIHSGLRQKEITTVDRYSYKEKFTPYYFSFVTLTTLGYGDIVPINRAGKFYCVLETLIGFIFLGIFVGLIQKHLTDQI